MSQAGGAPPRFRREGREFNISADGRMMAVALEAKGESLQYGTPMALFATRTLPQPSTPAVEYDVSADGQRLLIGTILDGPNAPSPTPVAVLDWTEGLQKRADAP
jgi:hypothetical protein